MIKNLQENATPSIASLLCLVGSVIVATTVLGQETNVPTKLKPVVVTGSLIPTFETITPAPVDVYSAADIAKTGVDNIAKLVQKLPSISGNASLGDSRGNGGDGSAAVGL